MELILDYDMLLVVCGQTRLLVAIHLQQLRRALKTEDVPSVQYTRIVNNVDDCHITVISNPEHFQKRYATHYIYGLPRKW